MTAERPDAPVDQDQAADPPPVAGPASKDADADTALPGWPVLPPEGVALLAAHIRRTRRP